MCLNSGGYSQEFDREKDTAPDSDYEATDSPGPQTHSQMFLQHTYRRKRKHKSSLRATLCHIFASVTLAGMSCISDTSFISEMSCISGMSCITSHLKTPVSADVTETVDSELHQIRVLLPHSHLWRPDPMTNNTSTPDQPRRSHTNTRNTHIHTHTHTHTHTQVRGCVAFYSIFAWVSLHCELRLNFRCFFVNACCVCVCTAISSPFTEWFYRSNRVGVLRFIHVYKTTKLVVGRYTNGHTASSQTPSPQWYVHRADILSFWASRRSTFATHWRVMYTTPHPHTARHTRYDTSILPHLNQ